MYIALVPAIKLAVCDIPKTASTTTTDALCSLNGHAVQENALQMSGHKVSSGQVHKNCSHYASIPQRFFSSDAVCETNSILHNSSGWQKVAFVRDPLERFLSGYLSKCLGQDKGGEGIRQDVFGMGRHVGFRDAAAKAAAGTVNQSSWRYRGFLGAWGHFRPQHLFCGGIAGTDGFMQDTAGKARVDWTVLPLTSRAVLPNALAAAAQVHGVVARDAPGWSALFGALPTGQEETTEGRSSTTRHNTHADEKTQLYYTAAVTRDVLIFAAADYRVLGLPVPTWALELLGRSEVHRILYSTVTNRSVEAAQKARSMRGCTTEGT